MAQILQTIVEYVANVRQKTTIWIVFNTVYNDVHGFKNKLKSNTISNIYLNKQYTDYDSRNDFLNFMRINFPSTKLVEVFDLVDVGYIQWPYLGSIAIDTDINSNCYNMLCKRYGDPYDNPISNKALLWVVDYKDALDLYNERKNILDDY